MTIQGNSNLPYDASKIASAKTLESNIQEMSAEQESSAKGMQNDQEEAVNPIVLTKRSNLAERTQTKKEVQKQELGTEAIEGIAESGDDEEELKDQTKDQTESDAKLGKNETTGLKAAKVVSKTGEEFSVDSPEGKEQLFDDFAKNASQDIENMIAQIEILEKKYPDKDPTMLILSQAGAKLSKYREKLKEKENIPKLIKEFKSASNLDKKQLLERLKNEFPTNEYLQNEVLLNLVADGHSHDNHLIIDLDAAIEEDIKQDMIDLSSIDLLLTTMCEDLYVKLDLPPPKVTIHKTSNDVPSYEYTIRSNKMILIRGRVFKGYILTNATEEQIKTHHLKFVTQANVLDLPFYWVETKNKPLLDSLGIKTWNAIEVILLHFSSFCHKATMDVNPVKHLQIAVIQRKFEQEHQDEIKTGEHVFKNVEMDHVEWADIRSRLILMVQSYRAVSMLLKKNIPSLERQLKHNGLTIKIRPDLSKQIAKNILNIALNPHHTVHSIIDMNKQIVLKLVNDEKK